MRLALIADLHFGTVPQGLAEILLEAIEQAAPDVVVIAGDLTQRARAKQFAQVKSWLGALRPPALILPGNHDLPYLNLLKRFANPYKRYREVAEAETLMPVFARDDGLILGFNTARSWQPHLRWPEGVARKGDIESAKGTLLASPRHAFKAVAAHHPFVKVSGMPRARPVGRARLALQAFSQAGVELIMSGHTHRSFAIEAEAGGRRIIAVGAPTALSWRTRGEANGFWIIDAKDGTIDCALWLKGETAFSCASKKVFSRSL